MPNRTNHISIHVTLSELHWSGHIVVYCTFDLLWNYRIIINKKVIVLQKEKEKLGTVKILCISNNNNTNPIWISMQKNKPRYKHFRLYKIQIRFMHKMIKKKFLNNLIVTMEN